ncbi:LexA family protein [Massilia haematophila]|uniref:LexA family protein n=1 Tax=Massilia haematophila TaxID=457923 RepID=A0ABV7PEZ4_9BURK
MVVYLNDKNSDHLPMTREEIRRENARKLAASCGGKAALGRLVKMDPSQVSQLIGPNPTKNIGNSIARRIEQAFELPANWLDAPHPEMEATADGEPQLPKSEGAPASFDSNVSPALIGVRPVPVISAVQAGALKDMENPYPVGSGFAVEYTDEKLSRWAFALDIEGLSMMPDFRPGDRVIIDPELSPNPGDFVVARNGSNQATFKKYRPRGMDANGNMVFELVPLNDDFPTLRSDIDHLIVIGVMTEHRKRFRRGG